MPDDLNAKLDALKALCDAATSPVHADSCASNSAGGRGDWLPCDCSAIVRADFLSASRTALPALIDCLQAADALYIALRDFHAIGPAQCACYEAARAKLAAALEGAK